MEYIDNLYLDQANELVEDARELERDRYKMLLHIVTNPHLKPEAQPRLFEALSKKVDRRPRGFTERELKRAAQIQAELDAQKDTDV